VPALPRILDLARRHGPLLALILLMLIAGIAEPSFFKPANLMNILRQQSEIALLAIGMTVVIILGGIDLSVGSLTALAAGGGVLVLNAVLGAGDGTVAVAAEEDSALAVCMAFLVMLLVGTAGGAINGALVTVGRIAPFIATLGGLAAFRSLALYGADGGEYRSGSPEAFGALGGGGIPIPGTNIAPKAPQPIPLEVPWSLFIVAAVAVVVHIALHHTRLGRYTYAVGCNERAAFYSAIAVKRVQFVGYLLLGACCGLAAMLAASRMNSVSSSQLGMLWELDAIAAVVIGGTRMTGGVGGVGGTLIGVVILGVIDNMLVMLGVSSYLKGLVKGVIIIGAVLIQRPSAAR